MKDMIGYIEGRIIAREERGLVILSNGIGYEVSVLPPVYADTEEDDTIALWTHFAVREDAQQLFGFRTRRELAFFRLLIGISGIGPKSAMNVLALADLATLESAIRAGDGAYLTKVSGIGKKLAEKIVLELKEKIGNLADESARTGITRAEDEAIDALEALGYAPRDMREIVRSLAREHATTAEIIRGALQRLGGR